MPNARVCPQCNKEFDAGTTHCPDDGIELTGSASKQLDEQSLDLFKRSVCPTCDAWNNWDIREDLYTCKSCNMGYLYSRDSLFYALDDASVAAIRNEKQVRESNPFHIILTKIDIANRDYWLEQFDKFDRGAPGSKWNWPSFFFDINRYFWKGLWKKGLVLYGSLTVVGIVLGVLQAHGALIWVFILPLKVYLAATGSKDYYRFVKAVGTDVEKADKDRTIGRVLFVGSIIVAILARSH